MPQQCRVCIHPQRVLIDAELTSDWERGLRAIGIEYGLTKDSVHRHAQNHLPDVDETETDSVDFGQKDEFHNSTHEKGATETNSQDLTVKSAAKTRHEKKDEPLQDDGNSTHEKSDPWAGWERK